MLTPRTGIGATERAATPPTKEDRLEAIRLARARVQVGQWFAVDAFRLDKHLRALGVYGPAIELALLDALNEIQPKHYRGTFPPEPSYEDVCKEAPLYPFAWDSASRGCKMYLKFCFFEDRLYIVNFHQQRERAKS